MAVISFVSTVFGCEGTWDPRCAVSDQRRDKLVSEQCDGSERGREKVAATEEKAKYRCSVRMIHCDCWRRIMINWRKPMSKH